MAISSKHLNQNLMCAIDCESTALNPNEGELIQLCILPLNPDYTPSDYYRPFEIKVKPDDLDISDPKATEHINRSLLQKCLTHGLERWTAVSLLETWFDELRLPPNKKIVPLGCNYVFDRDFILKFVGGPIAYEHFFRSDYRDVQMTALTINDMCDYSTIRIPFPKVKLSYLCSCLKVVHNNKHDALGDALATAEVYRRMMRYRDYATSIWLEADKEEAKWKTVASSSPLPT